MYVIDTTAPEVFSATVPANSTVIGVIKPRGAGNAFAGVLVHFERNDFYALVNNGRMLTIDQDAAREAHRAERERADTFFSTDEATA